MRTRLLFLPALLLVGSCLPLIAQGQTRLQAPKSPSRPIVETVDEPLPEEKGATEETRIILVVGEVGGLITEDMFLNDPDPIEIPTPTKGPHWELKKPAPTYAENFELPPPGTIYAPTPYSCDPCSPRACNPCSCTGHSWCNSRSGCCDFLRNRSGQWFLEGWLSAGATLDPRWPDNTSRFPNRYDDQVNKFGMSQLYFSFGRAVNKNARHFDIGGQVDLLFGTDYIYTSSLGLETETYSYYGHATVMDPKLAQPKWNSTDGNRMNLGFGSDYGLSMPQLFTEIFAPIGYGTTLKLGHFYSMMGYESPMVPENFFFSHSLSMTYGEPTTLTGGVLSQKLTPRLTGLFGITQGWDIWDNPNKKASYLAGAAWNSCDRRASLAFTVHTGLYDVEAESMRTNYSLVFRYDLSRRLQWVIQHDLGTEENGNYLSYRDAVGDLTTTPVTGEWASLSTYLFYVLTNRTSLGFRFEWFQDHNHSRIFDKTPLASYNAITGDWQSTTGENYYNVSLGLNWRPTPHFTFRPEVRWDWSDVKVESNSAAYRRDGVFDGLSKTNQFTVGLEGYLKF